MNSQVKVYASTPRTSSPAKPVHANHCARGLVAVIDVTAVTGSPSVVFTIQGYDEVSNKYWTILASAAITGTGTTVLRAYPGLTAVNNAVANDVLPQKWAIDATHTGNDSITYAVTAYLVE
jgi:hypothetical protein